ncbi:trimethylguanosine synthase [[Candida] anglica]|uniref:Trimethylguanosine synthase n=1 Tax=[Candida] anglica TaxID=148631 RepID=A0ABP0EAY2_9ASCO
MTIDDFEIETGAELLMHTYETLPDNCKKYWKRRYALFSKFDDGIYMTSELWFSVTPEDVASFTAKLIHELIPEAEDVLDVCCGGGGNSIQFANLFRTVGAIDINQLNLDCTAHNAGIYGVQDNIWLHRGDWNEMATPTIGPLNTSWIPQEVLDNQIQRGNSKPFDCAFSSPPWGGPQYNESEFFDLYAMEPFSVLHFARQLKRYSDNFIMYLPRNSDLDQLREVTRIVNGDDAKCRILYIQSYGRRVALLALWGPQLTSGDIDYSKIFPEDAEESEFSVDTL